MVIMMQSAIGVGYEGQTIDSFLTRLRLRDVKTVVDVRLTPLSRKRGFSKRALAEVLDANGIAYLHLPQLGNPKDNRDGFGSVSSPEGLLARERYVALLETEAAGEAVDRVVDELRQGTVALLCFEADEAHCHRHEVLEAIRARQNQLALQPV